MQTALPQFPTDDETLERLEHACRTAIELVGNVDVEGDASRRRRLHVERSARQHVENRRSFR